MCVVYVGITMEVRQVGDGLGGGSDWGGDSGRFGRLSGRGFGDGDGGEEA